MQCKGCGEPIGKIEYSPRWDAYLIQKGSFDENDTFIVESVDGYYCISCLCYLHGG